VAFFSRPDDFAVESVLIGSYLEATTGLPYYAICSVPRRTIQPGVVIFCHGRLDGRWLVRGFLRLRDGWVHADCVHESTLFPAVIRVEEYHAHGNIERIEVCILHCLSI